MAEHKASIGSHQVRRTVSQMLIIAKSRHFCDKIEECGRDSKLMFRTMYGLLGRGNISHMPKMDLIKEVVNSFSEFFTVKFKPFVMDWIDSLQPVIMVLRIYKQHHLNTI